jgi:hypothetical protein
MPTASEAFEQLEYSISGHMTAYEDAIVRGEQSIPEMESLREWLGLPVISGPVEAPTNVSARSSSPLATHSKTSKRNAGTNLPDRDPDGFLKWAYTYLDRRLNGYPLRESGSARVGITSRRCAAKGPTARARRPPRTARQEPPAEAREPAAPAPLRPGDPDGWLAFFRALHRPAARRLPLRRAG